MDQVERRRIVIYGPSGSGKTTLAAEIARRTGLPHLELDAVVHVRPNWQDLSTEEFRAAISAFIDEHPDGWVSDGNYTPVSDLLLSRADTAIWLHLPWRTVYPRLVRRTVGRSFRNTALWGGNHETLRQTFLSKDSMLVWGVRAFRGQERGTRERLRTPHAAKIFEPRSPDDVARLLERLFPAATFTSSQRLGRYA